MLARQIAIGFGIAIIFPLLIHYGVSTFHSPPKREFSIVQIPPNATADERKEYLAKEQERQKKYADAAKEFARILVIVSTPLGVAAIFIGAYLAFQAIGTGLILGGILSVSWGYWSYWWYLDDWIRFVSLLAGFAILIFVGIRRAGVTRAS
ncbi:hypothetical protein [Bradyrhizobium sp. AUGA SZCCT0160]|uniref:hypothetical protein n=1 Tax=Bradyrhizobium sp. AUGA SZCCT0160 TaxID=2807662 RepID=UPI001BA9AAB0|nr:hypothetical protein [Bradyrhizobium sp. AUGA SZCCT0160]MBR1189144.1 hypothetical protein [Bradyrhizobium sp. AUGA SZCCT0160]